MAQERAGSLNLVVCWILSYHKSLFVFVTHWHFYFFVIVIFDQILDHLLQLFEPYAF